MILATLCYIRKDGRTLMLHRNKQEGDIHKDMYVAPGGKFDPGEGSEECVIREILEESGLTIINPQLRGFASFINKNCKIKEDWYVFIYETGKFSGKLKTDIKDGELEWVLDSLLGSLPMREGDYLILDWLKQPRIFSAKLTYENDRLARHEVFFY